MSQRRDVPQTRRWLEELLAGPTDLSVQREQERIGDIMSNDYLKPGRPAKASLESNGGLLDWSTVHIPRVASANLPDPAPQVTFEKAEFQTHDGETRTFETVPLIGGPHVSNTCIKLMLQPTASAVAARLERKSRPTVGPIAPGEPLSGTFTVTLRFGLNIQETCQMPAVLYED